jgi:hypothetical protein
MVDYTGKTSPKGTHYSEISISEEDPLYVFLAGLIRGGLNKSGWGN